MRKRCTQDHKTYKCISVPQASSLSRPFVGSKAIKRINSDTHGHREGNTLSPRPPPAAPRNAECPSRPSSPSFTPPAVRQPPRPSKQVSTESAPSK
ncbi:hypothetical protein O3P69_015400 [Scylla paramamosain]|uniref:Uncharacterized protein n=1 Tax=Scylla paramamosain TaxID=85552 RepID=A0AAW0T5E9_SCYPA